MLIYARIVMILILLSSILGVVGSVYSLSQGLIFAGAFGFMWSVLFAWIAWTSWGEMKDCINAKGAPANF